MTVNERRPRFWFGQFFKDSRVVLAAMLVGMIAAASICAAPAQAYHRRGYSYRYSAMRARHQHYIQQAALAQLNAARQVLAAAESTGGAAQVKIAASVARLTEEATKFHEAQSITRHASKELAEIENEILGEQKSDSPYAQANKLVQAARTRLADVEQQILQEPAAQSQLSGLTGGKLLEKRELMLSVRPEYLDAKVKLEREASSIAHIRSELFQSDEHWKEAAESLTQARKEEKEAEGMTHSGASGRVGLKLTARNAAEAAAYARAAIAQAEAVLRASGGGRYVNSSSGASGSRNPLPTFNK